MKTRQTGLPLAATLFLTSGCVLSQPAQPGVAPLVNAAAQSYGARASVDAGPGVVKDKQTGPAAYLDNNPHSRYVMTGAPYTINIELAFKMPVEKISLALSDYATEAAPKDLEITFDDGQSVKKTLELSRPVKRKAVWQDVPVGREIKSFKVTVLSNYEGAVKWGGLADIAVWTPANLDEKFRAPGYDANAPTFVHVVSPLGAGAPVKVNLPPIAAPGEHPRLIFTPRELADFRAALPKSERGKAAFDTLLKIANGFAGQTPEFPDPKGPGAQLKDRGDELARRHSDLSKRAGTLGIAYALSNDLKYARAAAAILTGYARLYEQYPEHKGANQNDTSKVMAQRLSEAMWLIPQIEAYDYIYGSGALSDEDKKLIENGLIRPALNMIRRKDAASEAAERDKKNPAWRTVTPAKNKGVVGNWLNFYNTATMMAGSVMNDRNMMDIAAADFRELMINGIGEDGMWGEGAIGYQLFAMSAMSPGFEAAARAGIDLWGFDNARFKQLFDSPLRYAYPDGTLPGINDSGRGELGSWQTMVYDYGYLRYGDPAYARLLNTSPRQLHISEAVYQPTRLHEKVAEPATVKAASTLFGNLGYAILRDDTKYGLLDYGPHGGTHGHYDKLNLLLFANPPSGAGDEMGGEPKFHRYEDSLHHEWTIQTIAHNTLSVDEGSQMAGEGRLLLFEDTPNLKIMRGQSPSSYPGVLLDRTVVVTPDAVIDLFAGRSALEHTWDRTFRYNGKMTGFPAAPGAKPLGKTDGFQHFLVASRQPAVNGWQGGWETKAGKFGVTLAGAPGQQILLGNGPDKDEMALARQTGKNADFAAVYALDSWNNPVQTARWLSHGDAAQNGALAFEMTQKDGTTTRVIVAHNPGEWQSNGWKSDARVLCVRQKGDAVQVLLGGGTYAQNGALELRKAVAGNYLAQQKNAKLETVSDWVPATVSAAELTKTRGKR